MARKHHDKGGPPEGAVEAGAGARAAGAGRGGVRDFWQVPMLVGGIVLIVLAVRSWTATAPKPDFEGALHAVEELIKDEQYDLAIDRLNDPIGAHLGDPAVDGAILGRYHLLSADALYLAQKSHGVDKVENHRSILGHYFEARDRHHVELGDAQVMRIADTLISLGESDEAIVYIKKISPEATDRRVVLLKRMVDLYRSHDPRAMTFDGVMRLLSEMRTDAALPDGARRWTVARQAELQLDAGYPEEALRRIMPELQRVESPDDAAAGELFVLLGLSYLEMGDHDPARENLERAVAIAAPADVLSGRAALGLGRLAMSDGLFEEALDLCSDVTRRFPYSQLGKEGWMGVARARAALDEVDASLNAYETVIGLLRTHPGAPVTAEDVLHDLASLHDERVGKSDPSGALRFAVKAMGVPAHGGPAAAEVLRVAAAHRAMADAIFHDAGLDPGSTDAALLSKIDPVTLEEARAHYFEAAGKFLVHASQALVADAEVSADSVWLAADSYDRAGESELAARTFEKFVRDGPGSARRVEAEYRFARAMDSLGRCGEASVVYDRIISASPDSPLAHRSYVPLARCLLRAGDAASIGRAETLLGRVVDGSLFEPEAPEFLDAMQELAELYRRTGRFEQAIASLEEVRGRDASRADDPRLLFRLAEAHRLAAAHLAEEARTPAPGRTPGDLLALSQARLAEAQDLYGSVVDRLDAIDPGRLTPFETQMRRDAAVFRADAQFEVAEHMRAVDDPEWREAYKSAIVMYDAAAQRYANEARSLVAMVQIVNCYAALGRWREARTAHERARARLADLPESTWEAGDLPMAREHWEKWLESSIRIEQMAGADADTGG